MAIKEAIKKQLEMRAEKSYKSETIGLMPGFDEWIREKEKGLERFDMTLDLLGKENEVSLSELSSMSYAAKVGAMAVRIIPYSKVKPSFKVANYLEDILVFVNGALTDKAIPLLIKTFDENPEVSVCYGDEDIAGLDETGTIKYGRSIYGTRRDPYFKPDWSPNTFLNHFYFCNIVAVRRSAFRDFKWSNLEGAKGIYNTLLRYIFSSETNLRKAVMHIDEILVHASDYKMNSLSDPESEKVVEDMLAIPKKETKISVVIPSKDNPDLLEKCLNSLYNTFHAGVEIETIIVDNGSSVENRQKIEALKEIAEFKYLYAPMEFNFAKMINLGAGEASGKLLLILNDDITFAQPGTLMRLANQAKMRFTGAVGAKLLYPDSSTIQHAGVFNNRIGPVHKLQFRNDREAHYHDFNRTVNNVSAVTGACIMIRKEVFEKVGGMNENFKVAFNDIDLCFRLLENGYANVVCNNLYLYHAESVTRGKDTDEKSLVRLDREKKMLYELHPMLKAYDPYSSKYLLNDCLDARIVPANVYEYERSDEKISSIKKADITKARDEVCLQLAVEYADKLSGYLYDDEHEDKLHIQGFAYVMGSNNACYKKYVLLEKENEYYEIEIKGTIRDDVATACVGERNVERSGFSVSFDKNLLAPGSYRVGVLYIKKNSSEKLYRFSNKYMVVE